MRRFLTAVALTVAVAGCNQGKTYPLPADKVRNTLLSLRLPPVLMSSNLAGGTMVTRTGENGVRWTILGRDSRAMMSFVAAVDPVSASETRVTVSAEPAKDNGTVARNMAENPAVVKLFTKAMTEQIGAKLENRPFNMAAIQSEMMAAAIATMPKMQNEAMKRASEFQKAESEMYESGPVARPGMPDNQLGRRSY